MALELQAEPHGTTDRNEGGSNTSITWGAGMSEARNPTLASIENPVGQTLLKVGRLWSIIATYPNTVLSNTPAIP